VPPSRFVVLGIENRNRTFSLEPGTEAEENSDSHIDFNTTHRGASSLEDEVEFTGCWQMVGIMVAALVTIFAGTAEDEILAAGESAKA
jgi:hypothetical protein